MASKPTFSVNEYDKDGDISESGIFLHFGIAKIKVAESVEEAVKFALASPLPASHEALEDVYS